MNSKVPTNQRPTSPRRSSSGSQALGPMRPVAKHAALNAALDKLDQPGQSSQQRFKAWNEALKISLQQKDKGCLKWLSHLHMQGECGSNEFDASIVLDDLDLDTLERSFKWLNDNKIFLPVSVRLSHEQFSDGDEAATRLAQLLQGNQSLKSLELSNCGLDDRRLTLIAQALKDNRSIERLDVSHNICCGADGLSALAAALHHTPGLRSLNLNGLGRLGGLAKVFDSLPPGIEEIRLISGSFAVGDAKALARLLRRTNLKVLCLDYPQWSLPRLDEVPSKARQVQRRIKYLRLSPYERRVKEFKTAEARSEKRATKVADRIFNEIARNSTLRTLHIGGWALEAQHVASLSDALMNPHCCLREIMMAPIEDAEARQALADAARVNKTLITVNRPPTGKNFLDEFTARNRADHVKNTPAALHAIFQQQHLPLLHLDALRAISRLLGESDRVNVIAAAEDLQKDKS